MQVHLVSALPIQATSFIGRRFVVETLQALIAKRRLVTLVGSGGCGKTRLALQVAATQHERFEDGVSFIDLSPLTDGEQVPRSISNALNLKGDADQTLLDSILMQLSASRRLLVLDNCEHLLDACAEVAAAIFARCPEVHLLTTSRELLAVRGETVFRVPSLSVPARDACTAVEVMATESGRLFVERAADHEAGFEIDEHNAPVIAEICSRLDGIPLAIELAAAQVRTLRFQEICVSLNSSLSILTSGERGVPPRHRTIRATIEWSANRLESEHRRLLHRLSVFSGGFTLHAVDAICGDGEPQLDSLLALADKSLIVAREPGRGERRRLLETVRQFALEHLVEAGEDQMIRRRHRDFFLHMATDARPETHQDPAGWLARLHEDRDNLRTAIEWSLAEPDGRESALRMAADLGWFWYQEGQLEEGSALLSAGLEKPLDGVPADILLPAIFTLGWLLNSMGKSDEAAVRFKEVAALAAEVEDRRHEAGALNGLGLVAYHRDYELARTYFEAALAVNLALPDGGSSLANLNNLCLLALSAGRYEEAERFGWQTVTLARQKGRLEVEGVALFLLAVNSSATEQDGRARELFEEAGRLQRKHRLRLRLLHTLIMYGDHCMDSEDMAAALRLYEEAHDLCRELNALTVEHQVLCGLGACLALYSRSDESRRLLAEGLEVCKTVEDRSHLARALEDASVYLVVQKAFEPAGRLLGAAWKLRENHPGMIHRSTLRRSERLRRPVREAVGSATFAYLYEDGLGLSSSHAIRLALSSLLDDSPLGR